MRVAVFESQTKPNQRLPTILWYLFFGTLHEITHLIAAWLLGYNVLLEISREAESLQGHGSSTWVRLTYEILIGRQLTLPNFPQEIEDAVRHAGWIGSCVLLLLLVAIKNYSGRHVKSVLSLGKISNDIVLAALVTVLEAVATDLFGFCPTRNLTARQVFYCGNFGIILLNNLWLQNEDAGTAAMDTLQQMVEVTMMRGAQSGGVVFYNPLEVKDSCLSEQSKAIRTRIVNRKRTDLSKLVRAKVEKNFLRSIKGSSNSLSADPSNFVPRMLVGHTRFATTSLSTLDGTHPHQWTPPSPRRVYPMDTNNTSTPRSTVITMENYITHNGDFDFYQSHGKTFELGTIQTWLSVVTKTETPALVDSCAIAGMVDLLRTQGCFGLSARYALVLGMETTNCGLSGNPSEFLPPYDYLQEVVGVAFEKVLEQYCAESNISNLRTIGSSKEARVVLCQRALKEFGTWAKERIRPLLKAIGSEVANKTIDEKNPFSDSESSDYDDVESSSASSLRSFCNLTIDAFFDNDLFMTTRVFMKNAKGSFGISVTSNLDSYRQMCLAARGQTISIAFYPDKDLICYGSEQAAVKAGMGTKFELNSTKLPSQDQRKESMRLDLDDLGGEIIVLDWGRRKYQTSPVSLPHQKLQEFQLMDGKISAILYQESKSTKTDSKLYHRMTQLSNNPLIQPLQPSGDDPVLTDIQDIPRVCKNIQEDWASRRGSCSLNRLTAFHLSQCLRRRLEQHVSGTVPTNSVDILVTGCEVSLYLAEQFASDLQKSFPSLSIESVSSNKLLGIYGQDIAVPSIGFPFAPKTKNIQDSIVIIVSHSGGTFGPLACSNLLQSATQSIFVVTSEWDTQIGKQLRMMDQIGGGIGALLNQRIFSTGVGMRPAEPCSVSVAATHQLLTNIFGYICVLVLSDPRFCKVSQTQINEQDLQILERCNELNVSALSEIVGCDIAATPLPHTSPFLKSLYDLGNLWADHILEQTRAYICSFLYVFVTVTSGWPLISAIGHACGATEGDAITYFFRFLDACIYFWLPQIFTTIIRIVQGRNLRHRMVGRTVVIGDIPWVSQCADAFLSKCFAVSYSIAGLNVLSANPSDHLVHRHTHRVVRGTLAIFGRPDGRLSALSTAEASVCLSVNQASSIQSMGGTCESVTIGHNPFTLNLSKTGLFLSRHRPLFLCEQLYNESNSEAQKTSRLKSYKTLVASEVPSISQNAVSPHALVGAYLDIDERKSSSFRGNGPSDTSSEDGLDSYSVDNVINDTIREKKSKDRLHLLFTSFDADADGFVQESEFVEGLMAIDDSLTESEAKEMFKNADSGNTGAVDYNDFITFMHASEFDHKIKIPPSNHDERGLILIEASKERYFGEKLRQYNSGKHYTEDMDFVVARSQHLVQELYETRIASMQRFVAMCVLFHHISKRVERFFAKISFGYLAHRIDRTHSIVRIATTASPISGSDVRHQIERLRLTKKVRHSVDLIERTYLKHRERKEKNA